MITSSPGTAETYKQYSLLLSYKNAHPSSDAFDNTTAGDMQQRFSLQKSGEFKPVDTYVESFSTTANPVKDNDVLSSSKVELPASNKPDNIVRSTDRAYLHKMTNVSQMSASFTLYVNNGSSMSNPVLTFANIKSYKSDSEPGDNCASTATKTVWQNFIDKKYPNIYVYCKNKGTITFDNNSVITLRFNYRVLLPYISSEGKFKIEGNSDSTTSRTLKVTVSKADVTPGSRTITANNKVIYELLDVTDKTNEVLVWTREFDNSSGQYTANHDSNIEGDDDAIWDENGEYSFETFPAVYGNLRRKYQFRVKYDVATLDYAFSDNTACPIEPEAYCYSPRWFGPMSLQLRLPGESVKLDDSQRAFYSSITSLANNSVQLYWNNPIIRYAEGLKVNFEIMIGVNTKPAEIKEKNIAKVLAENREYPWQEEVLPEEFQGNEYGTFFYYNVSDDGVITDMEDMPVIAEGSTSPINENADDKDSDADGNYPYRYLFTEDQFVTFAKNYDRIYISIRPIILKEFNEDIWRDGTELRTPPSDENNAWQMFVFINRPQVHYCSDEYYNPDTRSVEYKSPQWRTCQAFYCLETDNGLEWKNVSARWCPTGEAWEFC